jgi:hypothetical protein
MTLLQHLHCAVSHTRLFSGTLTVAPFDRLALRFSTAFRGLFDDQLLDPILAA